MEESLVPLRTPVWTRIAAYSVVFLLFTDSVVWPELLDNLEDFLFTAEEWLLYLHVDHARAAVVGII